MGTDNYLSILKNYIKNDSDIIDILLKVKALNLPNWYIAAGFVRNFVWDILHGYVKRTDLNDIDIIYYDHSDITEETEKKFQDLLKKENSLLPWSIKNQARMHIEKNHEPYKSVEEAMLYWPETPTAVGVKLNEDNNIEIIAPLGLEDLYNLNIRKSPYLEDENLFIKRYNTKNWLNIWPKLKVIE